MIAATAAGLRSVPTTWKPLLANTAASGAPSLPKPTTEIFMRSSVSFAIVIPCNNRDESLGRVPEDVLRAAVAVWLQGLRVTGDKQYMGQYFARQQMALTSRARRTWAVWGTIAC